ncbi:MAG: glycosyltransferase [Parvularculaceae bacterium]|nr:glycosyltransferase [Parvularculaceae bacterium]
MIGFLLFLVALAVFLLTLFLALEIVASFIAAKPPGVPIAGRGRIAVVIPAHNEREGVAATVTAARAALSEGDRVIGGAENCDDGTAAAAAEAGAEAIERRDDARRGKGYALQFGVDHLRSDPPETVVFIDADCKPAAGAIERVAARANYLKRPVQALYLMSAPQGAGSRSAVSAFAWLIMNRVRMSGLQQLFGVTRLTGSGMAFPWDLIGKTDLASGEIVEDLALTIRMIEAGAPPFLDLGAVVTSELARSQSGATTQRARWERGSLAIAARKVPGLLRKAAGGDIRSFAMGLDLLLPPLTLFVLLIAALMALSLAAASFGYGGALSLTILSATIFTLCIAFAWAAYGRETLPASALLGIIPYLLGKARVYGGEGRRSAERWTRTDRGDGG